MPMNELEDRSDLKRHFPNSTRMPIPSFFVQGPDGSLQECGPDPCVERKPAILDNSPEPRDSHVPQVNASQESIHYQNDFQRWHPGRPHVHKFPQKEPWEQCRKLVSGHDADMCRSWKAEIDNLLIFAGLFSATVTAFTIESYTWLQSDSSTYDAQLLALIYERINPDTGTKVISRISQSSPFSQGPAVRINIYWFLSLSFSLTTVLIGILTAQWLREYEREVSLPAKARLALRQMRYQGLVHWQVPRIIALLPLLLQAGFILFLVGILELLWNLDRIVAIPITVFIGLVFIFQCVTVALPTLQYVFPGDRYMRVPQCPYKSPQSLGVLRFTLAVFHFLPLRWKNFLARYPTFARLESSSYLWSWPQFDVHWRSLRDTHMVFRDMQDQSNTRDADTLDIIHALDWVVGTFHENEDSILGVFHCIQELPIASGIEIIRKIFDGSTSQVTEVLNHLDLSTDVLKDLMAIAFLRQYQSSHSLLRTYYWESQIRLMNACPVVRNLADWSVDDLSFQELPVDIQFQLLAALNGLLQLGAASATDAQNTWKLLQKLMIPTSYNLQASDSRLGLTFNLFDSMSRWLTCSGELDVMSRAKICMDGVQLSIYDGFVDDWGTYGGYEKVRSFMQRLDKVLRDFGYLTGAVRTENHFQLADVEDRWTECMHWVFQNA